MLKNAVIRVEGMSCVKCESKVNKTVLLIPGITGCRASLHDSEAAIAYEDREGLVYEVVSAITDAGFKASAPEHI